MNKSPNVPGTPATDAEQWRLNLSLAALCLLAIAVIWITNAVLTERYSADTRARQEVRLALFSGGLMSEIRRSSVVPQLLSRDPVLIGALAASDYSNTSQRLIDYRDEIGAGAMMLLSADGRVVAATDRSLLGTALRGTPYVVEAMRANSTVFTTVFNDSGLPRFFYSRRIDQNGALLGIIVTEVDLQRFERSWAGITDAVLVTDSEGRILLTTEAGWRGRNETAILAPHSGDTALARAMEQGARLLAQSGDVMLNGQPLMRSEARIPFQGWSIVGLTTFASVRGSVNSVLAVEVMLFALAAALLFYLTSRAADRRSDALRRESEKLKRLNTLLQREMNERARAEHNLQVAEQSLAQSSKLAALGEMSAAVSHELNQPLAAMKTYLAGARLLLQRGRSDEAVSSFTRINGLIERMATITRQLKSYAGQGSGLRERVDMREAVTSSLAMMEPQLRRREIVIVRSQPDGEVPVAADRVRLEQVIVNLLRNAIDATDDKEQPELEILLSAGETVQLVVRDNGPGIAELDKLFEPFYTTKPAGEGLGLGLAISSSIASDLGGRLTARNTGSGASFALTLPAFESGQLAAE